MLSVLNFMGFLAQTDAGLVTNIIIGVAVALGLPAVVQLGRKMMEDARLATQKMSEDSRAAEKQRTDQLIATLESVVRRKDESDEKMVAAIERNTEALRQIVSATEHNSEVVIGLQNVMHRVEGIVKTHSHNGLCKLASECPSTKEKQT